MQHSDIVESGREKATDSFFKRAKLGNKYGAIKILFSFVI